MVQLQLIQGQKEKKRDFQKQGLDCKMLELQ
jgi:hypothetical protein